MYIFIISVDFSIKNDKKTSNLNKYIVSIRNNKPMIGLYKGFQHYSFDDKMVRLTYYYFTIKIIHIKNKVCLCIMPKIGSKNMVYLASIKDFRQENNSKDILFIIVTKKRIIYDDGDSFFVE